MPESTSEGIDVNQNFQRRGDLINWWESEKKESDLKNIKATVTRPSGKTTKVQIYENGEDKYSIGFIPKESGPHKVTVLQSGQHVTGSPYKVNVEGHSEGGPDKVLALGPGLVTTAVNEEANFDIWTAQAGEGKLAITVEGPSKPDIDYTDRKDGSSSVSYTVTEPGEYEVCVRFDDEHIPGSPFIINATGEGTGPTFPRVQLLRGKSDASKVTTTGVGIQEGKVGEQSVFTVNCLEAGSNMLVIGIVGPTGPCEYISVKHNENRTYDVMYTPKEKGKFAIIIKWGEDSIPGSPFYSKIC